jgi:hypothetical protein
MKTMKTELSPAAQAVKDAALSMYADCNVRKLAWPLDMPVVAAALRAAADQVVPEITTPWNSTLTPIISAREVRTQLFAIADELEEQL